MYACTHVHMHFLGCVLEQHPYFISFHILKGQMHRSCLSKSCSAPYNCIPEAMETGSLSQDVITAKQNLIKNQFLRSIKLVYFIFLECLLLAVTQFHCMAVLSVKNIAQNGHLQIFQFYVKLYNFAVV